MLHGTAVATLLRRNWERWTADPETIPGSPIADQSNGLKRGVPSPPQSGWRVVSEEMPGAEDGSHLRVRDAAMCRCRLAIASWCDAIPFGRVAGCRGADLPRLKPGQSGNPGGRPKRSISFQQICREEQPAELRALSRQIAAEPKHKQQVEAIKLMLAYDLGRPVQTQNVRVIRQHRGLDARRS